jgi:hypothetical protein
MPPAPATTTSTNTATLTGNIGIGTSIIIPINTSLYPPPATGTALTLDYTYVEDPANPNPPQGSIGDVTAWFKSAIDVDITLPDSFATYSVQILKLHLEAGTSGIGNAEIKANFGKITGTPPVFDDNWRPFGDSIPITLSAVTLDIKKTVS